MFLLSNKDSREAFRRSERRVKYIFWSISSILLISVEGLEFYTRETHVADWIWNDTLIMGELL